MSELARRIANLPPERLSLLLERLGKSGRAGGIPRRPAAARCELSFAQERFWLLERLHPGSGANHSFRAFRLAGSLEVRAFAQAVDGVVARHEALRATFHEELGSPYQRFDRGARARLATISLAALPPHRRQEVVRRLAVAAARLPFDLVQGPPVRVWLLRLQPREHALLLALHHIVSDGWSSGVLLRDLAAGYAAASTAAPAGAPPLPQLPVQYADFAVWQRRQLAGETLANLLGYWRERLAELPSLELPTDRPRGLPQSAAGASVPITLEQGVIERLESLSRAAGATLFATLCGLLYVQLARYSGQPDLALGTPVAGRNAVEVEDLVGCFVNTLVLRLRADEQLSVAELLAAVSREVVGALAHQDLPFAKLVQDLAPERHVRQTPLFQVMLVLQSAPLAEPGLHGLRASPLGVETGLVALDLLFELAPTAQGLRGHVEFRTDLFDRATVRRFSAHFAGLAAEVVAEPGRPLGDLRLLPPAERLQLLVEWNDTRRDLGSYRPIHAEVAACATAAPERTAMVCEGRHLSYGELARRAAELAARLRALGVGPEVRVAVAMQRSLELVVGTLAVLHAGGAYVPLDPSYPRERLDFMLADAGAPVLIADPGSAFAGRTGAAAVLHLDGAPAAAAGAGMAVPPPAAVASAGLAYVIYTSGSTGRPKGAMNSHGAVRNRLRWMQDAYRLEPSDRVLQKTPFSFDVSVWELFWPLIEGACMVLARQGGHQDPAYLAELIQREGVTTAHFVPSMLEAFLEHPAVPGCASLRRIFCSGEALPQDLADRCAALLAADLHNLYGPTEAAVDVTAAPCRIGAAGGPAGRSSGVSIGRPIANLEIYLLDRALRPVPIGAAGELYIGGAGLGRGYLGRSELTAERFVPDGCGGHAGARLYRSGDLARCLPDGRIQFLGRTDRQVKLRGYRIELQEIEAALRDSPAVAEAVVVGHREPGRDLRLVAYLVPRGGALPAAGELAAALRRRLPSYMVPSAFVPLDRLPLSPSGKLDPRALPSPDAAPAPARAAAPARPATATEEILAGCWSEILGRPDVGVNDDFFALGGHSLLASQLVARIRRAYGIEVPLLQIFEAPILSQLAAALDALRREGARPDMPPLARAPRGGPLPVSFAQQRFWFLQQVDPASGVYNLAFAFCLDGELALPALRRSLSELLRRHEVLRSTVEVVDGELRQKILEPAPVSVGVVDLSRLRSEAARLSLARRLAAEEVARPFDLAAELPLRACLLRLRHDRHWEVLTIHHVAADGWSMDILFEEAATLYSCCLRGEPSPLPELPVQYADYAVWQRRWLRGEVLARELAFWRAQLAGMPQALELPLDRPRPARPTLRGGRRPIALPAALCRGVSALARHESVTLFMALLAAFELVLARSSGQTDFGVGTLVAGRTLPETECLIGALVNSLVLRARLDGRPTGRELLRRAREVCLAAYNHQQLPFERLVEELQPVRDPSLTPLFQVVFLVQNFRRTAVTAPGLSLSPVAFDRRLSAFELTVAVEQLDGEVVGTLEHRAELFDGATMERLLGHYATVLAGLVEQPEKPAHDLPLLTPPERQALCREWNPAGVLPPRGGFLERFAAQVAARPDALALSGGGEQLSYAALDRFAGALAGALLALGVGLETVVAVWMERTVEMVAALLGVLKAGGAFLPLDPAYPEARLRYQLADSGCRVLLARRLPAAFSRRGLVVVAPGDGAAAHAAAAGSPVPPLESAAYVIYTSGSTGSPKGVVVPHAPLASYIAAMTRHIGLTADSRVLQFASPGFDVLIEEVFPAWAAGACVVLASPQVLASPRELSRAIAIEQVTVAELPAAYWHEWVRDLAASAARPPAALRRLLVGSELPALAALAAWRHFQVPLLHVFGLTEATVTSACYEVPRDGAAPVPIGRPIANTRLDVLDRWGQRAPAGAAGELHIAGEGLGRGFQGRPDATAERYLPDPFATAPGARRYRTGDLVRYRAGGELEFLGRADAQVKVRGFRIELGEIEATLRGHPAVADAAVTVREDLPGDRRLVAYVTPGIGWAVADAASAALLEPAAPLPGALPAVGSAALRTHLARTLPDHMLPAAWVALPALPLTPNAKLDRRALPAPPARLPAISPPVRPRLPVRELVAAIWGEVLTLKGAPDPADDFFQLGGHSLLATRLAARIRRVFAIELPIFAVFEQPTLGQLTTTIEEELRRAQDVVSPALEPGPRELPPPASFAQQRLWYLDQLDPGSAAYNVAVALAADGRLDLPALVAALSEIVRRHEALRTTLAAVDGAPVQVIWPPAPCPVPVVDLCALPEPRRGRLAGELVGRERAVGFDLARGPLLRAAWLRLGEEQGVLLLSAHHAVCDGWSAGIFVRELAVLYEAAIRRRPSPLPELVAQYADYAVWQRRWLQGEVLERHLRFWRERLLPLPPRLRLPWDRQPGAAAAGGEPRAGVDAVAFSRELLLSAAASARLRQLARQSSSSLFILMTAAFEALLSSLTGQTDFILGTNAANRGLAEAEPMIGFFVNQLALRADLAHDPSFAELLRRVRTALLGAWAHQDVPFDLVVEAVRPGRGPEGAELFSVKIDFDAPPAELPVAGARVRAMPVGRRLAHVELLMIVEEIGDRVAVAIDFRTDRFLPATVERWLGRLESLLDRVAADPDIRLSTLSSALAAAERDQLATRESALAEASVQRLKRLRGHAAAASREGAPL